MQIRVAARPKTHYKKRIVIAFQVDANLVSIIGVFYGGQNLETILPEENSGNGNTEH